MTRRGTTLRSEDVLRILSMEGGESSDRPALDALELTHLVALVEPPIMSQAREDFEAGLQRIFAWTVHGLRVEARYGGAATLMLREKAKTFLALLEKTEEAIGALDPGLRRLIDARLSELARAQRAKRVTPKSSMRLWAREVTDLIGTVAGVGRQLELDPVKGERNTVYRQMVRGLAALVLAKTEVIPKRSYTRRDAGDAGVEDYWFLQFCRRIAALAYQRAPQPPLEAEEQGADQLWPEEKHDATEPPKSNKGSIDKTESSFKAAAKSAPLKRPRKLVGPPSLTMVVREELEALAAEVDRRGNPGAGGEKRQTRRKSSSG